MVLLGGWFGWVFWCLCRLVGAVRFVWIWCVGWRVGYCCGVSLGCFLDGFGCGLFSLVLIWGVCFVAAACVWLVDVFAVLQFAG